MKIWISNSFDTCWFLVSCSHAKLTRHISAWRKLDVRSVEARRIGRIGECQCIFCSCHWLSVNSCCQGRRSCWNFLCILSGNECCEMFCVISSDSIHGLNVSEGLGFGDLLSDQLLLTIFVLGFLNAGVSAGIPSPNFNGWLEALSILLEDWNILKVKLVPKKKVTLHCCVTCPSSNYW